MAYLSVEFSGGRMTFHERERLSIELRALAEEAGLEYLSIGQLRGAPACMTWEVETEGSEEAIEKFKNSLPNLP